MTIKLTEAQKASLNTESNIIVEAGAGSGKTKILVDRLLKILNESDDITLDNIVAITFTEKAANELKERILSEIGKHKSSLFGREYAYPIHLRNMINRSLSQSYITTIHGLCSKILRKYADVANLDPHFSLLDQTQAEILIKQSIDLGLDKLKDEANLALQEYLFSFSINQLKSDLKLLFKQKVLLEKIKENFKEIKINQESLINDIDDLNLKKTTVKGIQLSHKLLEIFKSCLAFYDEAKISSSRLDFDDLMQFASTLLQNKSFVKDQLQIQFKYIFVDEFQDTDDLQWKIISALHNESNNMFIVGDTKQSIYSFRGANPTLFKFATETLVKQSKTDVISLMDNFRSAPKIITWVNNFFEQTFDMSENLLPEYKPLIAAKKEIEGAVNFCFFQSEKSNNSIIEAAKVVEIIHEKLKQTPSLKLGDIAILFRSKSNMKTFKDILEKYHIPSAILTTQSFYREDEVIVCYNGLKALLTPEDNLAWIGLLKSPLIGLNNDVIFLLYTNFKGVSFLEIFQKLLTLTISELESMGFSIATIELLKHTANLCVEWPKKAAIMPLSEVLEELLEKTAGWALLANPDSPEQSIINCESLIKKIKQMEKDPFISQIEILENLKHAINSGLVETEESGVEKLSNVVNILSIHGSKGLEYPIIFVADCGRKFNTSSSDRIVFSKSLGLGLTYNTHNEEFKNQLKVKIREAQTKETLEEEKRIFYVACTRAQESLYILGSSKNKPEKITTPKSFLELLIKESETKDSSIIFQNTYYPLSTSVKHLNTHDVSLSLSKIPSFKTSAPDLSKAKSEFTPTLSPTLLEKASVCLKKYVYRDTLEQTQTRSLSFDTSAIISPATFGTLLHKVFELAIIHQTTSEKDLITMLKSLYLGNINSQAIKELTRQLTLFKETEFYKASLFNDSLLVEFPFSLPLTDIILDGRIDLAFKTDFEWHIVDYKSKTSKQSSDSLNNYSTQLLSYALALRKIKQASLPIKAYIYYSKDAKFDTLIINEALLNAFEKKATMTGRSIKENLFRLPSTDICIACGLNDTISCRTNKS